MRNYLKITIYSIAITLLFVATRAYAGSATLFMTGPSVAVNVGDSITIDVRVSATDEPINAVSGTITFPSDMLQTASISRDGSILNIWTHNPIVERNQVSFEGVILNPGYEGNSGLILHATFQAKKAGTATISFKDGSILANDGLGTNIIKDLKSTSVNILDTGALDLINKTVAEATPVNNTLALPVITDYSQSIDSSKSVYLKGKGEPNYLTQIAFENVAHKSFGEQFMDFIQSKKKQLTNVYVKNDANGSFEYVSPNDLIAGVYNVTPFLVNNKTNTNEPGLGVQLLVNNSKIVRYLIIFINILILLIPIVGLIMIIYFIPWYSSRRMHILNKKMGLEEEKISLMTHQLERQDKVLSVDAPPPPPYINAEK